MAEEHGSSSSSHAPPASAAGQQLVELQQQQQQQQQQVLQLPEPVVSKLLSLDAGDLDLMIQHPAALQAQVYELLDVLEASGPQGLAHYAVPHLSWEEVTALTGPGTVGLPVGYTPGAQQQRLLQLGRSAGAAALQLPAAATSGLLAAAAADEAGVAAGAGQDTRSLMEMQSGRGGEVAAVEGKEEATLVSSHAAGRAGLGWRQRGWQRAQYLVADGGV
ncbi:hypothetical protein OEZ85_003701 [Tetradesmus obliquus]|uniref:Uncharacterized protein n=1 Tax=Tetradesmus obliquus TaxID=3088 RepID=A0ABY8UC60_TETOB|nr:hypothetical protein OEZ85_003701 [Tetradesmus obliquus]